MIDRPLPTEPTAEAACLCSMMIDDTILSKALSTLTEEHFSSVANKLIYRCIAGLYNAGIGVDMITVGKQMKMEGTLDQIGGTPYLNQVSDAVLTADHFTHHARLVTDTALVRHLILQSKSIIESCYAGRKGAKQLVLDAETAIENIAGLAGGQHKDLDQMLTDYQRTLDDAATNGYPRRICIDFDFMKFLHGFDSGGYYILAARPKMGKSAVANAIVIKALEQGKRVLLVNNEMDEQCVINRMISRISQVDHERMQTPNLLSDEEHIRIMHGLDILRTYPLNLCCLTMKTPNDIKAEALRLADSGKPVDLIVIDYMQLMHPSNAKQSRYEEVSLLSWEIKMLANDLRTPVLALSQLNRKLEERTNKRPIPADLRDSGSLEQDATAVLFLYRDEVYNPNSDDVGVGEINVSINRNGRTGVTYYSMMFEHMDIGNLTRYGNNT